MHLEADSNNQDQEVSSVSNLSQRPPEAHFLLLLPGEPELDDGVGVGGKGLEKVGQRVRADLVPWHHVIIMISDLKHAAQNMMLTFKIEGCQGFVFFQRQYEGGHGKIIDLKNSGK